MRQTKEKSKNVETVVHKDKCFLSLANFSKENWLIQRNNSNTRRCLWWWWCSFIWMRCWKYFLLLPFRFPIASQFNKPRVTERFYGIFPLYIHDPHHIIIPTNQPTIPFQTHNNLLIPHKRSPMERREQEETEWESGSRRCPWSPYTGIHTRLEFLLRFCLRLFVCCCCDEMSCSHAFWKVVHLATKIFVSFPRICIWLLSLLA